MKLYTIKDLVKDECLPPIPCKTDGQAWREFDVLISRDEYAKTHAEEYTLLYIGEYDTTTGVIDQWTEPQELTRNLNTEELINAE